MDGGSSMNAGVCSGASRSVLMICPQFRPEVGGYEIAAERLSRELGRNGAQVTVVTWSVGHFPRSEHCDGYLLRRLWYVRKRGLSGLTSCLSLLLFLYRHGRHHQVWHAHAPCAAVALAFSVARFWGIATVLKVPSTEAGGTAARSAHGGLARLPFLRTALRNPTAVIAMSELGFAEARAFHGPATLVATIPNGVDVTDYRPVHAGQRSILKRRMLGSGLTMVLCMARLAPHKNHALLLSAWALMPAPIREGARLLLVGDGPLRERLEASAHEWGLSTSVMFAGEQRDTRPYYQMADLFALSSDYEGLSNSMLEAMAAGLPVIRTQTGGSEWVSTAPECGLVVPRGDAVALANGLATLIENPELRDRLGRNARHRAMEAASLEAVTRKVEALYDTALSASMRLHRTDQE